MGEPRDLGGGMSVVDDTPAAGRTPVGSAAGQRLLVWTPPAPAPDGFIGPHIQTWGDDGQYSRVQCSSCHQPWALPHRSSRNVATDCVVTDLAARYEVAFREVTGHSPYGNANGCKASPLNQAAQALGMVEARYSTQALVPA